MDTIYALASARGKSGVAVIRVSGPDAYAAGTAMAGQLPGDRVAGLRVLRDAAGVTLDQALVLCFPQGASFTGEPVVEFQIHGSVATVKAVLHGLSLCNGCRPAEAGEFTRRALENERLDLARVEGLGDLIEAETEAQRLQAQRVFSGELGRKAEAWRESLIHAASLIEATIDFADEDVPVDVMPEVCKVLNELLAGLKQEAEGSRVAERVRDGFEVAIVGPPNIGKSTLLNYLAGRDAAITSDVAGTTRDIIEVRMDLEGLPVTFLDTAGLREAQDEIETVGIERTISRAENADMRVFLVDQDNAGLNVAVREDDLVLRGKSDISDANDGISGLTGKGVDQLVSHVVDVLQNRVSGVGVAIQERHRVAILRAMNDVEAALDETALGMDRLDIMAEELRSAITALDSLVGRVDVELILDSIFARFCIGK